MTIQRLFSRQLDQSTRPDGTVDIDRLAGLVIAQYTAAERDRRRTDRSIGLMIEELDEFSRGLERAVAERTAALRAREAELEAQNLRFDAAINNMSQALLMFDESARLVICNNRYLEMYNLPPGVLLPGRGLLDIIEYQVEHASLVGRPEQLAEHVLAAAARRKSTAWLNELPDGRTISVRLHPIADGGWVTTHEDISDRRDAERRIAHMVRHDPLTDLPNRLLLRERLVEAVAGITSRQKIAVLYLDVDQFKAVNDMLGHVAGDDVLKALAARLAACMDQRATLARVGGDEFAIVRTMPSDAGADISAFAMRVAEAVRIPFEMHGRTTSVDVSFGISIGPDDATDASDLVKNAELALQRAKAEGRGLIRYFEPEMDARMKQRRALEAALRAALSSNQFRLHYQPAMSLASGEVTTCEALIRWRGPDGKDVEPAEFIPIAEEIGMIVPLGEWVVRQACADALRWHGNLRVAINLSPLQLLNPRLVPVIVNSLAASGLPAGRLEIEITESVLMQNTETTVSALHQLRDLGIRIAMDDFGTGYSSLSNLRLFPFDKIKIDRSFVSGLPEDENSAAIVRAVAALANSLNMSTTAEGVETAEQAELCRRLGCSEIQGFYFSHPCTADHVSDFLSERVLRLARSA
ncbi:MAG TPA: EAL domain-containing protein [Bauldia sp.]|nr:EAL domain-containing protein [Bauldia sp.]